MKKQSILIAVLFLCIPSTFAAETKDLPVVLLTGFEPFMTIKVNPSWETVKTFQGQTISGHRVETVRLPVVYDEMEKPLLDAIKKFKPAAVISFGVGSETIQVETYARNGYHPQRPPDNKHVRPSREQVVPGSPKELRTQLPAEKIIAALKAAKIGASESTDAGGYLCNECFYRLMNVQDGAKVRGFVHVPDYDRKDPEGGVFDSEKLKRAVEIVVKTSLESK